MRYYKAELSDTEQLIRIRLAYLSEDLGELSNAESAKIADSLPSYFADHLNRNMFAYIAADGDNFAAAAFLVITEKPASPQFMNGRTGLGMNVYTFPEYRHKGIASKLVRFMLDDAKNMNLDYVELKATDAGYGLYKKLGFEDVAEKYKPVKYVLND